MSQFGSQRGLNIVRRGSRPDLTGAGTYYARSEVVHGGNGFGPEYMDGYNTYTYSKGSMGGGLGQGQGPSSPSALSAVHQKAYILQGQCQEYLRKAEFCLQSGGDGGRASGEAERYMAMARETIEGMKACAVDLRQMGQPNDSVIRSVEICRGQLKEVHMVISGSLHRRNWGSKGSGGGGWEDPGRSFQEAMAWIGQQKRLIETSPWGDDSVTIEQQLNSHNKFHSCIQRSVEVDRARDELMKKGDKANLHSLDQEWDSLQKMSFGRTDNLRELQSIIEQISKEIIWVNEREEEELVFDWGDRNIDVYIPEKQESYSKLMSALEEKEKDLNKLKTKVDVILKNNHPAADKIEAYMDTLQTQWSWLLQITKCIYTHLKENAAYSQFFKEANETYSKLQKEHDTIRKKFTCDKNTPLDNLQELIKGLEREKERIVENKRQVQHLVNKSKSIVRLRPRNPDEKSSSPVIVEALCDFKQDQKVICKGNDAILKDNSQRSKWLVTGPGGLDMVVPSVCLLVPPPNPLSINLASKNEQYYEAILTVWNQLYINIKSLISWQYCVQDITRINSLTLTMLARMRPDEYRSLIQTLETRYEEFKLFSRGSQMFGDEDRRSLETQYSGAQTHYDQLVVQLPAYTAQQQQLAKEEELRKKKEAAAKKRRASSHSLTELHALRARLDTAEAGLTQHVHVCLGEDGAHDCGLRIVQLEAVQLDIESARDEYQRLRERIQKELEGMTDSDKAHFLRSEVSLINQRLSSLEGSSSAYLQRLRALRALLESVARCEDIVKVHEARLTEKETTSLDSAEVDDYESTLKGMRAELELKRDVLVSMETELAKAVHWNDQVGGAFHRCDVDLSKYGERVAQLTDRWRRIQGQIDSRLSDLAEYLHQLQRYRGSSSAFSQWVDSTRLRLDALQAAKIDDIAGLNEHLSQQRALNSEIKGKRDDVESVVRDNDACVASIKDYELELATYGAGLETLLNIPFKRTVLQSPSTQLTQEATLLQTHYIELLTLSGDYYKYLGEMLKNMEELKMRDTRIDLLEEELRLLKEDVEERRANSRSLEEVILRYRLELTQSQQHLLSAEEVQRSTALECTSTQDSLDSAHGRLREAGDQATRLAALIEEEKRKRRLAEERFGEQREELEAVLRRRQKELEEANWAKLEAEKSAGDGEREAERLRRLLAEETGRGKRLEQELSKTSSMIQSIQTRYADLLAERDALLAKLKLSDQDKARSLKLEEELNSVKLSLESELRLKRRLQEENEQVKKDFLYWKGQCDSEKERLERERSAMRRETERLTRELRVVEETHKSWQLLTQTELTEMTSARAALEAELRALRERPDALAKHTQTDESPAAATLDPSVLIFVGVRKTVTAQQLLDCRVIDKPTFNQLLKGQRTVSEVSVDIKLNLKGTGIIAGVCAGPRGKMSFTEARKANLLSADSAILLLEAQAATGHMVDPGANEKLTVSEALARGVVDEADAERLLAAEAAAVGYRDPNTAKLLSAGQAMRKGLIDRDAALRLLQAQESVGGILDPALSVFLPKDAAVDRDLIDEDLYRALNQRPECYLDPDTQMAASYVSLKRKCKVDPSTGLLLIPEPEKPVTVQGLREPVNVWDLVDAKLLEPSDLDQLRAGKLTSQDIETRLRSYLRGSASIAGVYDEASGRILPIYQAMKEGILRPGTTLELLEAQAASGFMIDPVDNLYLTVNEAYKKGLHGPEFKEKLLSAERAVTGYKDPGTDKIISLFQAIEKGLIEKGHGIRLLEAQIASGGIIDPHASHRIEVDVAYKKGYFGKEMNRILTDEGDDTKGFFDPNTEENLTYLELKRRCIMDKNTGLVLLPIKDKKNKSTQKNTLRKRRVVIVDPDTNKEMTVQEAYDKKLIDYETFLELSGQECEWEEITITAPDGSVRLVIIDRKTGRQYDIQELLEQGVIGQSVYEQYRAQTLTLTQFADVITSKSKAGSSSSTAVAPPASSATATSAAGAKSSSSATTSSATTSSATTSSAKSSSATTSSAITSSSAAAKSSSATTSSAITSSAAAKSSTTTSSATTSSAKSSSATTPSAITSSSAAEKSSSGTTPSAITSSAAAEKSSSDTTPSAITSSSSSAAAATSAAEAASKSTSSLFSSSTSSQRTMTSTTTRSIITAESSTLISSTTISGSSSQHAAPLSPSTLKHMSSVSITLASPAEGVDEQTPVGAIFDMEALEKISISEALKRGLVDSITAQRLLEAQACTGGIINPANGRRMGIQEAFRNGIIEDDMATRLKPAQKAYIGFEDVKSKKKMSAAEAMKEKWLPYEAGHRFLEFQYATGGLFDPELGRKRTIEEALQVGWLDGRSAQKLQDTRHHGKNLTCPKTKLKISYKEAMDNCLVEETTGVRMLQAATSSSKGISSPYNVSSAPGSASGSRSGSRRGSMDLGSSGRYTSLSSYSRTSSFSSRSLC